MKNIMTAAAVAALFAASPAIATTVDFTSTPTGITANPLVIGDATFSSVGDLYIHDWALDGNNQVCANVGSTCAAPLDVTFAAAVSGLSFTAWGDDALSTLTILMTLANASPATFLFALDGTRASYDLVDLSGYGSILSLSLTSDDPNGLVFDNFNYVQAAAVPEPGTWAMMLFGFGLTGFALRRRRRETNLQIAV